MSIVDGRQPPDPACRRFGDRPVRVRLLLALAVGTVALASPPAPAGELGGAAPGDQAAAPARPMAGPESAPAPAAPGAGMTIHLDPQTGALAKPRPGLHLLPLSPAEANALSTSHVGLVEAASPVPGGGVIVDLLGRFRSPLVGTVGADGAVTIRHLDGPAPAGAR